MRTIVLLFCLSVTSFAQLPQAPPPASKQAQTSAEKKATASIAGTVLTQEGDKPVRKATVILTPESTGFNGPRPQVQTDADGHFIFKEVAAGRYRLGVQHPNFTTLRTRGVGTLSITDGQEIKDIVLRMLQAAVIKGVVLDEDGEPMPRAMVQAMRQSFFQGKRRFMPFNMAQTDDRGEFRMPSLGPGRYCLAASSSIGMPAAASKETRQYVRTFYAGTTDMQNATTLQVKSGDEIPVNLTMMKVDTVVVRGTVLATDGSKPAAGQVSINSAGEIPGFGGVPAQLMNGAFEARVPPGRYTVMALVMGDGGPASMTFATQKIEVGPDGSANVKLQTGGGSKLTARVRFEGGAEVKDVKYENVSLMLSPKPEDDDMLIGGPFGGGGMAKPNHDGIAEFANVLPGNYDVGMSAPGAAMQDWYLKSVVVGTHDVTTSGLRVAGSGTQIEVLLSPAAAKIEGAVLDGDQHAVKAATVVVVPEGDFRKDIRNFRNGMSDQYGHFSIHGVRPGRYTLLALENADLNAVNDPEFLKPLEDKGEVISVSEKDAKQVQLKFIPASEIPDTQ